MTEKGSYGMSETEGELDQDLNEHEAREAQIRSLEETIEELSGSLRTESDRQKSRLLLNLSEGNTCHLENGSEVIIAGLGRRVLAGFLDRTLFGILYMLSFCLMLFLQSAVAAILVGLFALLLEIGYQMTMLTDSGQTIGRKVAGIRVVMFQDEAIPNAKAIFMRGTVCTGIFALPWVLLFSAAIVVDASNGISTDAALAAFLLWVAAGSTWCLTQLTYYVVVSSFLWNVAGQGWHDRVAGTIVVRSELSSNASG